MSTKKGLFERILPSSKPLIFTGPASFQGCTSASCSISNHKNDARPGSDVSTLPQKSQKGSNHNLEMISYTVYLLPIPYCIYWFLHDPLRLAISLGVCRWHFRYPQTAPSPPRTTRRLSTIFSDVTSGF